MRACATARTRSTTRSRTSINPSLGILSPTSFRPGTLTQEESGLNIDFVKTFANSPVNLAFGAELRNETYEIGAGDTASIEAGPTAAIFGVGSDGFQGFPAGIGRQLRKRQLGDLVDLETDLTDALSGGSPSVTRTTTSSATPSTGRSRCVCIHRQLRHPRDGQHGFPRADAGSAEYAERHDHVQCDRPSDTQRHLSGAITRSRSHSALSRWFRRSPRATRRPGVDAERYDERHARLTIISRSMTALVLNVNCHRSGRRAQL